MKKIIVSSFLLLLFSISTKAQNNINNEEIISDFYQGTVIVSPEMAACTKDRVHGNCVSIAIVKAALVEFESIENVFKEYKVKGSVVYCTFQDDVSVNVSPEEIQLTKDLSGFVKTENAKYYEDGILLYALMCKRILVLKNQYADKCLNDFQDAVEFLNTGFITENGNELLALKKDDVKKKQLKSKKSAVIWTRAHAAYCSYGMQDILGKKHKIKGKWMKNPRGWGGLISNAYTLTK